MPLLLGLHFKLQWTSLDLIGAARWPAGLRRGVACALARLALCPVALRSGAPCRTGALYDLPTASTLPVACPRRGDGALVERQAHGGRVACGERRKIPKYVNSSTITCALPAQNTGRGRWQAMTQQPAKLIPQWLRIDCDRRVASDYRCLSIWPSHH